MKGKASWKGQGGGKERRDRKYHESAWRPGRAAKREGTPGQRSYEEKKNTMKGPGNAGGPGLGAFMV